MQVMSGWGTPSLLSTVKPKPVDEFLIGATVRNIRVNGLMVKACRRFGIIIQAL